MTRRSIGIALIVLAAISGGQSAVLAWDYAKLGPAIDGLSKLTSRRDWDAAYMLAKQSSCPEVLIDLLESTSRTDEANGNLNEIALNRIGAFLRGQAVYSGLFAAILFALGISALRRESDRRAP